MNTAYIFVSSSCRQYILLITNVSVMITNFHLDFVTNYLTLLYLVHYTHIIFYTNIISSFFCILFIAIFMDINQNIIITTHFSYNAYITLENILLLFSYFSNDWASEECILGAIIFSRPLDNYEPLEYTEKNYEFIFSLYILLYAFYPVIHTFSTIIYSTTHYNIFINIIINHVKKILKIERKNCYFYYSKLKKY